MLNVRDQRPLVEHPNEEIVGFCIRVCNLAFMVANEREVNSQCTTTSMRREVGENVFGFLYWIFYPSVWLVTSTDIEGAPQPRHRQHGASPRSAHHAEVKRNFVKCSPG